MVSHNLCPKRIGRAVVERPLDDPSDRSPRKEPVGGENLEHATEQLRLSRGDTELCAERVGIDRLPRRGAPSQIAERRMDVGRAQRLEPLDRFAAGAVVGFALNPLRLGGGRGGYRRDGELRMNGSVGRRAGMDRQPRDSYSQSGRSGDTVDRARRNSSPSRRASSRPSGAISSASARAPDGSAPATTDARQSTLPAGGSST